MTLAEFLLARIAEDEAVAQSAPEVEAKSDSAVFTSLHAPTGTVEMSPARVLAECEAKRLIVERLQHIDASVLIVGGDVTEYRSALLYVLRAHASVYADHPDFDSAWKL